MLGPYARRRRRPRDACSLYQQEPGPPPGIPARIEPEFESRLVRLCEWHGLAPLLLDSLQRLALASSLSQITLERLKTLSNGAITRNEQLLAALRALVRRLREKRIPCLLVDDAMAALTLYPRHRLRPSRASTCLFVRAIGTLSSVRAGAWVPAASDGSEFHRCERRGALSPAHLALRPSRGEGGRCRREVPPVDIGHTPKHESAWRFGKRMTRDIDA